MSKTLSASDQAAVMEALETQGIQFLEDGQVVAGQAVAVSNAD
ncbi:MAG: hypothetical protein AAF681_12845 [Pseudomonadota bacterium]